MEPSAGLEPARSRGRSSALCPLSYEGKLDPSSPKVSKGDPAKRVSAKEDGVASGSRTHLFGFADRPVIRSGIATGKLDPGVGLEPTFRRSERRVLPLDDPGEAEDLFRRPRARRDPYSRGQWLWVPAFAGTPVWRGMRPISPIPSAPACSRTRASCPTPSPWSPAGSRSPCRDISADQASAMPCRNASAGSRAPPR
jgi:hypothetical protein